MKYTKRNYLQLGKLVKTMRINGYKWLGNGYATFNGKLIDLTATGNDQLAIAYTTLSQISEAEHD